MEMNPAMAWWIATGVLVGLELASGSFYLLMLAVGTAAAAVAAHLGLALPGQMLLAAVIGGGAVSLWHRRRSQQPRLPAEADRDVNLDVGQSVEVQGWNADGTATVRYRGADWRARYQGSGAPVAGRHVIRAVDGSCLLLDAA